MIEDADIVQVTRDPDDEPKSLLVPAAPCHRTPVSACGHDRRREDGAEQGVLRAYEAGPFAS